MKIIKNIDERLADTINPENPAKDAVKFRTLFRMVVSNHVSLSGEAALEYVELGLKLGVDKPDVELEDAEFKKLKEVVNANPLKWPNMLIGQLYKKIIDSEKN